VALQVPEPALHALTSAAGSPSHARPFPAREQAS
jgi:hypothetical protein